MKLRYKHCLTISIFCTVFPIAFYAFNLPPEHRVALMTMSVTLVLGFAFQLRYLI
jgi:hypothetical protein